MLSIEQYNVVKFDRIVKPEKGLKKVIRSMVTQRVTARENNKEVTKYVLYYSGEYIGYDAYDNGHIYRSEPQVREMTITRKA
jgi:hypothetical protein